ncbi:hypothetical protein A3C23_04060 [Candidatus Roizmanbacteria bacterium RIFCSPHIGHO2_02_FULL_37_13b]|nr:MAG: hypothetical protein A3C23_04060 [Candidatus Roizmanbacteria bacterium RIFCSPHIGHO2_02_FULL_37_13b]
MRHGRIIMVLSLYYFLYLLLISVSAGVFFVFKPFKYINHIESSIYCFDGKRYGANTIFMFSLDGKLDLFNDKKARKQCAYSIIFDYYDMYKTPNNINYRYVPVFSQESSLMEAFLAAFTFFLSGAMIIEKIYKLKNKIFAPFLILFSIIASCFIFVFFVKPVVVKLHCQKKIEFLDNDIRRAMIANAFKSNFDDDDYVAKSLKRIYDKCIHDDLNLL